MRTSDPAVDRLEELLRGAPPESRREAELERLVRELRTGAPAASPALRERLRRPQPAPQRRRRIPAGAIAFAAAVLVVGSVAGVLGTMGPGDEAGLESTDGGGGGVEREGAGGSAATHADGEAPAAESRLSTSASGDGFAAPSSIPPPSRRARDVQMSLELRVRDADAVSAAANEAMAVAARLGGHVAASSVQARGNESSARLILGVPVNRLEDAVPRLSVLGTITAQDVDIEDLQGRVDARASRIELLQRSIRRDEIRLRSETLSAEERLQTELRLESLRAQLRSASRARAELLRRAANAEIRLALHTREAPAAEPDESALSGAVRDAWRVLHAVGVVAVFLLIAGGPLVVVGVALWLLLRARGRRVERRLLEEPRPAGARPPA